MPDPIIPDGQELIARIKRHLEDRPGDERMIPLWLDFVAGLREFGMLDRKVTREIQINVLPNIGGDQLGEIYLGTRQPHFCLPIENRLPCRPIRSRHRAP